MMAEGAPSCVGFHTPGLAWSVGKVPLKYNGAHFKSIQNVAVAGAGLYSFERQRTSESKRAEYLAEAFPMNVEMILEALRGHMSTTKYTKEILMQRLFRKSATRVAGDEEDRDEDANRDEDDEQDDDKADEKGSYDGPKLLKTFQRIHCFMQNVFCPLWVRLVLAMFHFRAYANLLTSAREQSRRDIWRSSTVWNNHR